MCGPTLLRRSLRASDVTLGSQKVADGGTCPGAGKVEVLHVTLVTEQQVEGLPELWMPL